jgi:hypothetical protein
MRVSKILTPSAIDRLAPLHLEGGHRLYFRWLILTGPRTRTCLARPQNAHAAKMLQLRNECRENTEQRPLGALRAVR